MADHDRCSYEGCRRPHSTLRFYHIDGGSQAGGQDWRELTGSVLCNSCYLRYMKKGTLERTVHRVVSAPKNREREQEEEDRMADHGCCSYEGCKSPHNTRKFTQIDGGSQAGGQDWRELAGSVLCESCYILYRRKGRLERTQHQHEPLAASARRCSYVGCKSPHNSRKFTQIDGGSQAGGQDWRVLAGSVLCESCYMYYKKMGRLERTRHEPLAASERRCSYEGCKSPHKSSQFYQIDVHSRAGGQDWRELAGSVLCDTCYKQYRKMGTLERTVHRVVSVSACARRRSKRPDEQNHIEQNHATSSRSSSSCSMSSKRPRREQQKQQELEEEEE
jgi:hypothetical protein